MPRLPSALGLGGAKRTGGLDWTLNPPMRSDSPNSPNPPSPPPPILCMIYDSIALAIALSVLSDEDAAVSLPASCIVL
eukprot:scaffold28968_cov120-Isochrysis_galbana.AAC.5